jgi:hypothetical protein
VTASGRASGGWVRGEHVWSLRTSTGTVVLVAGARAAVALSEREHVAWTELSGPQPVPGVPANGNCGSGPGSSRAELARLAGIGAVVAAR